MLVLLLVATALAGCSSDETPDDETADDDPTLFAGEGLDVPTWQPGDWWTYQTTGGGTTTLVVTDDSGSDYTVDTNSVDTAFYHAAFGPLSYLGPIAKADLAGDQGGTPVRYFDWPLENQKTWRTTWDGMDLDMVAHDRGNGQFHVQGYQGDVIRNQFLYDNATRWFEWMSFSDDNGTETYRMDLQAAGTGYTGEVVRVTPEVIAERHLEGAAGQSFEMFGNSGVLSADDADAYLMFHATCATGAYTFAVGTAESTTNSAVDAGVFEDQGFSQVGQTCPSETGPFAEVIGAAPGNGDHWGFFALIQSPDLVLDFTLYLRHVERIAI